MWNVTIYFNGKRYTNTGLSSDEVLAITRFCEETQTVYRLYSGPASV